MSDVTRLLKDWSESGNRETLDELLPLVYDELRRLAHRIAESFLRWLVLIRMFIFHI